jgi:hypothetical protein
MQEKIQSDDRPRIEELQRIREQDLARIVELEKKMALEIESLKKSQEAEI